MLRLFTPVRLVVAGIVLAAATVGAWAVPSDDYIFLPNRTHEVAPLVEVEGGRDPAGDGGIYFVDVLVREATLLESLWPGLREGATVVPAETVRRPGVSENERRQEELAEMERSQRIAAAVALRELGHDVTAIPRGARVEFVDPTAPAAGKLRVGDLITAVDGTDVRAPSELRREIRSNQIGDNLRIGVKRGEEELDLELTTTRGPEGAPIIGVIVSQAADIELPLDVEISSGRVGGPSAGLAFALALLEELGRDVTNGRQVAVTGSLELDGTVGNVGGVKQKAIAVRRAGMPIFVVPAGENAELARQYAGDVRVVAVTSFQQALQALATSDREAED